MDQATFTNYALGYIASMTAVFLLFLPFILGFVLLLVLAGAVQLAALLLKAVVLGTCRNLARLSRNMSGRLPGRQGHDGLVPH